MTNASDEQISALVDGELDDQGCHAAVDELLNQSDFRKSWGRYHLIGDALRRSLPRTIDAQFSARVMAALEDEPTVLAPRTRLGAGLGQRLAGLAVAASVAAVAVLGVQFMYQQDASAPIQPVAQAPAGLSPAPQQNIARATIQPQFHQPQPFQSQIGSSLRSNVQTVTQSAGPVARIPATAKYFNPRLNKYLVDHNQQASTAIVQSVIPYARIVAYPNSHHILIQAQK